MFTGIIEELGRVRSVERRGEGVRMTVEARVVTGGTRDGDSIAVNGVCLTALEVHVDARGTFLGAEEHGGSWTVRVGFPKDLARYLVFKGSVSVEGISLTVAAL